MRSRLLLLVLLAGFAMACAAASARASALPVRFEAGTGSASLNDYQTTGTGWFAGASVPLTRWFALGAAVDGYRLDPAGVMSIPEQRIEVDDSRAFAVTAVSRLDMPLARGIAPFLTFGTGWGTLRQGDRHITATGLGASNGALPGAVTTVEGERVSGMCSTLDFGVAGHWSRPWPQVEVGMHLLRMATPSRVAIDAARLVIRY